MFSVDRAQTQSPGRPQSAVSGRGADQGEQGRHQPRGQAQDRQQGQPRHHHWVDQTLICWNEAFSLAPPPINSVIVTGSQVNTKFLESLAEKSKQHEQLEAELGCSSQESLNILSSTANSAQGNINPPGISHSSRLHISLKFRNCEILSFAFSSVSLHPTFYTLSNGVKSRIYSTIRVLHNMIRSSDIWAIFC